MENELVNKNKKADETAKLNPCTFPSCLTWKFSWMSLYIAAAAVVVIIIIVIILIIVVVMLKLSRECDDVRAVSMFIRSVYHNKIAKGCKVNYTNRIRLILFHLRVCVAVRYFAHACIYLSISHKYVHSNTYKVQFMHAIKYTLISCHFFLSHSPLSLALSLFRVNVCSLHPPSV